MSDSDILKEQLQERKAREECALRHGYTDSAEIMQAVSAHHCIFAMSRKSNGMPRKVRLCALGIGCRLRDRVLLAEFIRGQARHDGFCLWEFKSRANIA